MAAHALAADKTKAWGMFDQIISSKWRAVSSGPSLDPWDFGIYINAVLQDQRKSL